jgi:hypothetical protein
MKDQRQKYGAIDAFMIVMSTFGLLLVAIITAPIWSALVWGFG